MGKLILCSGARTNRPYAFASTGFRAYSMEELCYYLVNYVYTIDENTVNDSLIDWIDTELKLSERADKLRQLLQCKADLKTIITVVLCSSDYYSEYEIKGVLKMLDSIVGMPTIKRKCLKANNYLNKQLFAEAAKEYENIIASKEIVDVEPVEYGDILHNLAVAKVHIAGLEEATEIFHQAFARNHKKESMKQYLYCLHFCGKHHIIREKLIEYAIDQKEWEEMNIYLDELDKEAQDSDQMHRMQQLNRYKSVGKMNKFYKEIDDIMEAWKTSVRLN